MVICSNTHVHLELQAARAIILAKYLSLVRSSPTLLFCPITYSLPSLPRSPTLPKLLPLHQQVTRLSDRGWLTRPVAKLQLASSVIATSLSARKCEFPIIWLNCSISNSPSLAPSATPSSHHFCVFPPKSGTVSTLMFSATHYHFRPNNGPGDSPVVVKSDQTEYRHPDLPLVCRQFYHETRLLSYKLGIFCFYQRPHYSLSDPLIFLAIRIFLSKRSRSEVEALQTLTLRYCHENSKTTGNGMYWAERLGLVMQFLS